MSIWVSIGEPVMALNADDDRAVHVDAVLSPEAARRLRDMLDAAL